MLFCATATFRLILHSNTKTMWSTTVFIHVHKRVVSILHTIIWCKDWSNTFPFSSASVYIASYGKGTPIWKSFLHLLSFKFQEHTQFPHRFRHWLVLRNMQFSKKCFVAFNFFYLLGVGGNDCRNLFWAGKEQAHSPFSAELTAGTKIS